MEESQRASPGMIIGRLEIFRSQYARGAISPARYKQILAQFRFKDDYGRVWAPGSNSSKWYMWDGNRWSPYAPPNFLTLPTDDERFQMLGVQNPSLQTPKRPTFCTKCGNRLSESGKFCTRCGTPI